MKRRPSPARALAVLAVVVLGWIPARPAHAAPTKEGELDVVARYVFSKAATRGAVNEIVVRVENLAADKPAQGRVFIGMGGSMPDSGVESNYRVEPGGVVYLHLPLQVSDSFTARVRVEKDGVVVASEEVRMGSNREVHVVDLAEATRLFGLNGMHVGDITRTPSPMTGREVDVETPYVDAATGELILPAFANGWVGVSLAIITSERLARVEGAELEALSAFVLSGGTLAVSVTRDEDLRVGTLPTLLGGPAARVLPRPEQLRQSARSDVSHPRITSSNAPRMPGEMTAFTSWAGGNLTPSSLGATAQYGLGRVVLLGFDLAAPGVADDPWVQLRLAETMDGRGPRSLATPGWPTEDADPTGRARYLLNPERTGNWGVGLSAILLCIYAIIAGPIAFSRAKKQNRPLRALVWLPIFSLVMFAIVLGIGATARGSGTRARRLTFVDAGAGMDRGVGLRFRAVLFPNAATFDAAPERRTSYVRRASMSRDGEAASLMQVDRDGVLVKEANVAPYETAVLREEGIFPIGAGISVSMTAVGDVVVRNRTGKTLKSVLVKLPDESLRFFTDLAPDGTVTATNALAPEGMWRRYSEVSNELSQIHAAISDGGSPDDGSLFLGVSGTLDHDLEWLPLHVPVVIATFDEPSRGTDVGAPVEWDRTLIRVVGVGGEP